MGLNARLRNASIFLLVPLAAAIFALQFAGCGSKSASRTSRGGRVATEQAQYRQEALHSAISLLNTPEQMDDNDKASEQIVDSLNQWRRLSNEAEQSASNDADDDALPGHPVSKPEGQAVAPVAVSNPLIDALPDQLKTSRWVRRLDREMFDPKYDGTFLLEAAMLRDVAGHAAGQSHDDLGRAEALFDWTIRNIQLEPQPLADSPAEEHWLARHLPIETIFYGRGTWRQRAWVFMLLARQAGLDVVMLALPDSNDSQEPRPWLCALVSNNDLFLFDPVYGLPILGPGGKGIATLSQAAENDAVLRQMDVPGGPAYPRKSGDVQKVVALLDGTPGYFEPRMKQLESQLKGRDRIILSVDAAALAEKLRVMRHVDQVRLWTMPLETLLLRMPPPPAEVPLEIERARTLEKLPFRLPYMPETTSKQSEDPRRQPRAILSLRLGRLLHLRGAFGGTAALSADEQNSKRGEILERGAKYYYVRSITTTDDLEKYRQIFESHSDVLGRPLTKEDVEAQERKRDDATYWLGLVLFEQHTNPTYESAKQYFKTTLNAPGINPWTNGARYNLARCYEALGQFPDAIKLYEADRSAQRNGNYLRAARLKNNMPTEVAPDSQKK